MLTGNLLERAFIELETEEWEKADELLEQVLNTEPRNAQAYIGKLMAELRVMEESKLAEQTAPIDGYANFKKAVRFADDEKKAVYNGYNEAIIVRQDENKQGALPLIERAIIALEFEEWDNANTALEKAMKIAPDNPQIYIYRMMSDLHISKEDDLLCVSQSFVDNENYKKAITCANEDKRSLYRSYGVRFTKPKEELHVGIWNILEYYYETRTKYSEQTVKLWRFNEMSETARAYYEQHVNTHYHRTHDPLIRPSETIVGVLFLEDTDKAERSAKYDDKSVVNMLIVTDRSILYTYENRSKLLKEFRDCSILQYLNGSTKEMRSGVTKLSTYCKWLNADAMQRDLVDLFDRLIEDGASTLLDSYDFLDIRFLFEHGETDNIRNVALDRWLKLITEENDISRLKDLVKWDGASSSSDLSFVSGSITDSARVRETAAARLAELTTDNA